MSRFLKAKVKNLFAYEFNGDHILTPSSIPPLHETNYTEDDVMSALIEDGRFLDVDIWDILESGSFPAENDPDGIYTADNGSFESLCIKRSGSVYLYVFDDLLNPTVFTVDYARVKF